MGPAPQLHIHSMIGFLAPELPNSGWLYKTLKDCFTTVVYTDSCDCFPLSATLFYFFLIAEIAVQLFNFIVPSVNVPFFRRNINCVCAKEAEC